MSMGRQAPCDGLDPPSNQVARDSSAGILLLPTTAGAEAGASATRTHSPAGLPARLT